MGNLSHDDSAGSLKRAQSIFDETVPEARCELWDGDARIRCAAIDCRGDIVEVDLGDWRGLATESIRIAANELDEMLKARSRLADTGAQQMSDVDLQATYKRADNESDEAEELLGEIERRRLDR